MFVPTRQLAMHGNGFYVTAATSPHGIAVKNGKPLVVGPMY